jgi:hypothetical protein
VIATTPPTAPRSCAVPRSRRRSATGTGTR